MPFEATVELLIHIFISLAMLCIGMSSSLKDMGRFILERERLLRVLAANVFIPPIIAVLIIAVFPIPRASGVVLFLLAFAPGGINAVQFSTKAPGQNTAAGALLFLLSLIGLILVPAAAQVLLPVDVLERFAWDQLALRVFGVVGVPLVAGVLMRVYLPDVAEQIYKPVMLISTASFIASVMMSLSIRQEAASELGFATILAMLVFIVSLLAVGWFLGGDDPDFSQVLAICTNLRNVGLVYLLVEECCFNPLYSVSILAFMALMVPVNLVFTILCAVMRKRREKLQHQSKRATE
ncbi:bile acid:sodium symporter [Tropicibacter sp. R16_0]|uniref:bile acid:sodium symporter family protein n=1 Tax=Tropicibacter sp. R16_0 TaxID=2821102 RepID=UPI001ADABCAA|nr:bile acid:sodium symporter [Tropicibacter sp. R16_0]MBO9453132.1 bile acid:sodium symporter [Tropicibacter sp. R16_0]